MKTLLKESVKISVIVLSMVFVFSGANLAQALWSNAPVNPPDNNAPAPINVSVMHQTKEGGLTVGSNSTGIFRVGEYFYVDSQDGSATGQSFEGGEFLYISDARLKKDVELLSMNKVNDLLKLEGVSFIWKENNKKDIGFIAQEVEKVYPEIVNTDEKSGYKSVKYANLIAPLIELTKYQQKRIEVLEAKTQSLEARLERLEKEL